MTSTASRTARVRFAAMAVVLALVGSAALSIAEAPPAAAATGLATNNATAKTVTFTGLRYSATLSYNNRAVFTSLVVDGYETLDPAQGIYSAINNGAWITTQSLSSAPTVTMSSVNVATVVMATAAGSETWTVTANDTELVFALSRTYGGAGALQQQGTPMMNFAENSFSAIRWAGDGGSWPVGGALLNAGQPGWLATGASLDTLNRAGKEQAAYTLLSAEQTKALQVTTTTNHPSTRPLGTEVWRATNNDLRLATVSGAAALQYATGLVNGHSAAESTGHMRTAVNPGPIFAAVPVAGMQTDVVTTTFTPRWFDEFYDLGTLNGVDEEVLAKALDYARWTMQDTKIGGSAEAPPFKTEVPALEMQWIGQLIETFPSTASIESYKGGLTDIRDYLLESSGEVTCCYPGSSSKWGRLYGDRAAGYALGVVKAFELSGDTSWLSSMAASVRGGLDWQHAQTDSTGLVKNSKATGATDYVNNYWESSVGAYDGYSSALYYEALTKWAQLESAALSSPSNAATFTGRAATLKTSFNKDVSLGGFWSPTTSTFLYGSANADALYLPVNAEVLKSDLASGSRQLAIVNAIEVQARAGQYDFHPMNVKDLFTAGATAPALTTTLGDYGHPSKIGENGGWYGAPDGDFESALPLLNNPQRLHDYVTAFVQRYQHDGFYNASTYNRNAWLTGLANERWFPTHVMPLWALYRSAYGFQPAWDKLVLAPNISPGMVGSVVKYNWRGNDLSVGYVSQKKFTVTSAVLATPVSVRWINQTPGSVVHYTLDGGAATAVTVDSKGVAQMTLSSSGSHTVECTDCAVPGSAGTTGSSFVTAVSVSGAALRNDVTEYVGMKITVPSSLTVKAIGRYFVPGNAQVHLLKIVDSAGKTVASTSVDLGAGTADGNGFKYGALPQAVTLAAGTYYVYSLEARGGDQWYDNQVVLSHTSAAGIASAAYRRSLTSISSTNHSYGPLNLLY